MFNRIRNIYFRNHAQRYLKSKLREHRFVNYAKAKSVLILFDSDVSENNPAIRTIINLLLQDGKKVTAWGFVDKKEIATSIMLDYRILNHQKTDWHQKPQSSYLHELENMEFDLLIDLSLKPVLPILYMALYANASFKAGVRKTDLPIYDFILDINTPATAEGSAEISYDESTVFDRIIFYLKSIQTKD